jgi:NDP-sugar pyrophosphorylase family protein
MTHPLVARVRESASASELTRAVASVRQDGGITLAGISGPLRNLTPSEIEGMESLGNRASHWQRIRVFESFDFRRVRGCSFFGEVVLGRFSGEAVLPNGVTLPNGLYDSTIVDCVIGENVLVRDVRMLARYVVGAHAVLFDCSSIVSAENCQFGNGTIIGVGPQAGSRQIPAFAEIDLEIASALAKPSKDRDLADALAREIARYSDLSVSLKGIVGQRAVLVHTGRIERTFVGNGCQIRGASAVTDSTLLGSESEPVTVGDASCVHESLVQWGAAIGESAIVERSVLMEYSSVGRHGKVADSLIGPNSAVAVGEVTACLIGPFVAAQHQSLLISLVWPEGRGNAAHGANVGSNHTSRCADQECWPGEGMFFGLGVNVKFPANFSRAPFSVLAPGLTIDPQSVEFPFSLITAQPSPQAAMPSTLNEIQPAWMLDQNLFALYRVEAKHRSRNHAKRLKVDFGVLRPDNLELMRIALRRLEGVAKNTPFYTERDIPGLGRNVLFEPWRQRAIAAYRRAIALFALMGMRDQLMSQPMKSNLLQIPSEDASWEYQRTILTADLGISDPIAGLKQLLDLLDNRAQSVEHSRAKDHVRGCRVIDDYFDRNDSPAEDEIVQMARGEAEREGRATRELIERLEQVIEPNCIRA